MNSDGPLTVDSWKVKPVADLERADKIAYAAALDEGIKKAIIGFRVASDELVEEALSRGPVLAAYLSGEGINASYVRELDSREEIPGLGSVRVAIGHLRVIGDGTVEYRRRHEDITERFVEEREAKIRDIEKRKKLLSRSFEDYIGAALELTEIEELSKTGPTNETAHFFILRDDGLYEGHVDLRTLNHTPLQKREGIDPKRFNDKGYLEQFRTNDQGLKANVYLVRNPCKEISHSMLGSYAFDTTQKKNADAKADEVRRREEGIHPGRKLADIVRVMTERFRRK